MQKQSRMILSVLLLGAFLLSACSGAMPGRDDSPQGTAGSQATEVVFTGTVQTMGGGQWTISGQSVGVDGSTSVDANVKVGDIVRVEARVFQDGSVLALKVESSLSDDMANGNDSNSNGTAANSNDAAANSNDVSNTNANANANSNDDNSNSAPSGTAQEFNGVVEAITTDSITINGVTYSLAAFTEFKDIIAVGDQVKIHVIVNADGSLTIREIERITGTMLGDDNDNGDDNSNLNSNDDNSNDDSSNANSNDDDSNDDNSNDDSSNANSNDDDSDDDNSNDDDDNDSNDND